MSVLTPPFLMCAAVVVAIVAFLRHEMGRGGKDEVDPEAENSDPAQITDPQLGGGQGADEGPSTAGDS